MDRGNPALPQQGETENEAIMLTEPQTQPPAVNLSQTPAPDSSVGNQTDSGRAPFWVLPQWDPTAGAHPNVPFPPAHLPGAPNRPSCPSFGYSNIRFLFAAVDQPPVNVRLGGQTVIQNLQYGNATPYYMEPTSSSREILITNTRTGAVLLRESFEFLDGFSYTMAIVNRGSGIALESIVDNPCGNQNAGCIRAVNLSPNSGPLDVFLSAVGRVFHRVNPYEITENRLIRPGAYRVFVSEALPCESDSDILMAGTYVECGNTSIAIEDTAILNVRSASSYTLYLIGRAYGYPPLQILPLESDMVY